MTVYCIDDGGDGSQTNATQSMVTLDWSKADTSIANLLAYDAAAFSTSGNVIYFGHDHVDPGSGNLTYSFPSSGAPCRCISADRTQSTPTYLRSTTNQIASSSGYVYIDGAFWLEGVRLYGGATGVYTRNDVNENGYAREITVAMVANGVWSITNENVASKTIYIDPLVDLTADGTTGRSAAPISVSGMNAEIYGLKFTNSGYRTGTIFSMASSVYTNGLLVSGADFSEFTNGTTCEIVPGDFGIKAVFSNCKTKSSPTYWTTTAPTIGTRVEFYNCANADAPESLHILDGAGQLNSDTSIYRTGGAAVEDVTAVSWKIDTTGAAPGEYFPFRTPWIYGTIASTGSKTFTVCTARDGSATDYTDAELWLEIEVLETANSPLLTLRSDYRGGTGAANASSISSATDQPNNTEAWTGLSGTETRQTLSVGSVTVGETGMFRARVCFCAATAAVYVDPKVTVS